MAWLNEDSAMGKKFQMLEDFMRENKIAIDTRGTLHITIDGNDFKLHDRDNPRNDPGRLPRTFEEEVLKFR